MSNLTRKIKVLTVIAIVGIAGLLGACNSNSATDQWSTSQVASQYAQINNTIKAQIDSENVAFTQEGNGYTSATPAALQETLVEFEITTASFATQVSALEAHTSGTVQASLQEAVVAANNESQIARQSAIDVGNGDVNAINQDTPNLVSGRTTFINAAIAAGSAVGNTYSYGA